MAGAVLCRRTEATGSVGRWGGRVRGGGAANYPARRRLIRSPAAEVRAGGTYSSFDLLLSQRGGKSEYVLSAYERNWI